MGTCICTLLYYFLILFSFSMPTSVHCCYAFGTEEASGFFKSQKIYRHSAPVSLSNGNSNHRHPLVLKCCFRGRKSVAITLFWTCQLSMMNMLYLFFKGDHSSISLQNIFLPNLKLKQTEKHGQQELHMYLYTTQMCKTPIRTYPPVLKLTEWKLSVHKKRSHSDVMQRA